MRPTRIGIVLALAALLSGLAACSGQGDLHQWVAQVKARKGAPLPALPVVKTFETFTYQDQDERDPFEPAPAAATGPNLAGPHPDQNRPRQPLESFPLDSLKMVGTLGSGKNLVALVMAPDKVTYRVSPGTYLGQSDGRVTGVYEDRIELVELVPDGAGGWLERPAKLALEDN